METTIENSDDHVIERVTSRITGRINSSAYDKPTCKKITDLKELIICLAKEIKSRKHLGAKDEYTVKLQDQLTKAEKELSMIAPSNIKVTTTRERQKRINDKTTKDCDRNSDLIAVQGADDCLLDEVNYDDTSTADGVDDLLILPTILEEEPPSVETISAPVRNTSEVDDLYIDPELESLLPPLSSNKYAKQERKLKKEGCHTDIDIWNNNNVKTLVDGHNCYKICKAHSIPFKTRERPFASKDEVKIWIIENQVDRRNLNTYQLIVVGLKWAQIRAPQSKENQLSGLKQNSTVDRNSDVRLEHVNITQDAADFAEVHYDTASMVRKILKYASDEDKKLLDTGDKSINEVYNSIIRKEKHETSVTAPENLVVESKDKINQVLQANPKWSKLPIKKLGELKVKELIDENTVLFICTKSPAHENTVTTITSNRCATVKYGEWIRLIEEAHEKSTDEDDLITLVMEKIVGTIKVKSNKKGNSLAKK